MAVGLAMPFPAMSGAEPCTASNTACRSPRFAPGTTPSPPTYSAARSDTTSPYTIGSHNHAARLPQLRAGTRAQPAHQSGGEIRHDIAIQIRQQQYVEGLRPDH